MSTAAQKAKEKFQAVLNAESNFSCELRELKSSNFPSTGSLWHLARTNRIGTTRHPSSGGCEVVNKVDYPNRRRSSTGSVVRDTIKDMLNRPAY